MKSPKLVSKLETDLILLAKIARIDLGSSIEVGPFNITKTDQSSFRIDTNYDELENLWDKELMNELTTSQSEE